ncbi:MAG: response regulator [Acidobacteriota bacterium]|nr:response regulator [Acidobacteriota bacterium]MDQ7087797.1 response regulator [Acidobacteriota bacterium]
MALNVLITDDSKIMRAAIIRTLQMADVPVGEIHQAENGQEALEVLDRQSVDLLLADINMPVMNGEELLERVRAHPAHQPLDVIVISSEASPTRIHRIEGRGACFIRKPIKPHELRRTVMRLTGETDDPDRDEPDDSDF